MICVLEPQGTIDSWGGEPIFETGEGQALVTKFVPESGAFSAMCCLCGEGRCGECGLLSELNIMRVCAEANAMEYGVIALAGASNDWAI